MLFPYYIVKKKNLIMYEIIIFLIIYILTIYCVSILHCQEIKYAFILTLHTIASFIDKCSMKALVFYIFYVRFAIMQLHNNSAIPNTFVQACI